VQVAEHPVACPDDVRTLLVDQDSECLAIAAEDGIDRRSVAGVVDRPVWLRVPGCADGRSPWIRVWTGI